MRILYGIVLFLMGHAHCHRHPQLPFESEVYLPMSVVESSVTTGGSVELQTNVGQPFSVEGVVGSALSLDGQSALLVGSSRSSCFWMPDLCTEGFTLSIWFKVATIPQDDMNDYVISNGGQTAKSYGVALSVSNTRKLSGLLRVQNHRFQAVTTSDYVMEDTWFHIVLTWSESAGLSMYANGSLVASAPQYEIMDILPTVFHDYVIGRPNGVNTASFQHYFNGRVDEFMFWPMRKNPEFATDLFLTYLGLISPASYRASFADQAVDERVSSGIIDTRLNVASATSCRKLCAGNHFCFGVNWADAGGLCQQFNVVSWWNFVVAAPGHIVSAKVGND